MTNIQVDGTDVLRADSPKTLERLSRAAAAGDSPPRERRAAPAVGVFRPMSRRGSPRGMEVSVICKQTCEADISCVLAPPPPSACSAP